MAELVSDELWDCIEPLLPPQPPPSPKGGRPRVEHRPALTGIVFVLRTGIPWQNLPKEMGCGSGSTCWRRFAAWTGLAVWPKLHRLLLTALGKVRAINLERAVMDSASVRVVFGGRTRGRTPLIEPKKAANATSRPKPRACPWLSRQRLPTRMTAAWHCRWSPPCLPSLDREDGREASPRPCKETPPTGLQP